MDPSTVPWISRSSSADSSPCILRVGVSTDMRSLAVSYGLAMRHLPFLQLGVRDAARLRRQRLTIYAERLARQGDGRHTLLPSARNHRRWHKQFPECGARLLSSCGTSVCNRSFTTLHSRGRLSPAEAAPAASAAALSRPASPAAPPRSRDRSAAPAPPASPAPTSARR